MNIKNMFSIGAAGLFLAGSPLVMAAADTPPAAESTPSEIKSPKPLAEQIDAYNANRATSSAERGRTHSDRRDPAVDPKARRLADDINTYNASSQPDESATAIDEHPPSAIDRQRSAAQREATDRLGNDVRQYNESGGATAFSDDGDD